MAEQPLGVDVWRVRLSPDQEFVDCLSADERVRADRFVFDDDRRRFARTRSVLRCLLGRQLGREPARLVFAPGPHGKPALADQPPEGVRFSVSHSGDLALIALAAGSDVGIDVERIERRVEFRALARENFSPEEALAVEALPEEEGRIVFFRLWTIKEAYLKATGAGITGGLANPRVRLGADAVALDGSPGARGWTVREMQPAPGYAAAACVAAASAHFRYRDWTDRRPNGDLSG